MTHRRPHPPPRFDDTGRELASRALAAHLTGRDVDVIRRLVEPVACDVASRAALLDLAELGERLASLPTRKPRKRGAAEKVETRRAELRSGT